MKIWSFLLGLLGLMAVGVGVAWQARNLSPGELHATHARIAALGDCDSCHGDDPDELCLECHALIRERRARGTGLHGASLPCAGCHVEHLGDEGLLSRASFTASGIPELDEFDHHTLSLDLSPRHQALACQTCHPLASAPFLESGQRRYLGVAEDCRGCHDDPHEGAFGGDCAACHDPEGAFADAARELRHSRFPLVGGHSSVSCETCHGGDRSVTRELSGGLPVRRCVDCHDSPHASRETGRIPLGLFLPRADDCARCHDRVSFADVEFGVEAHRRQGIDLTGAHAHAECSGCHDRSRVRSRLPDLGACEVCHSHPHAPGGPGPAFSLDDPCELCHDRSDFRPHRFPTVEHFTRGGALDGAHRDLPCRSCHVSDLPATTEACDGCHDSPHRGALDGVPCAECHLTESWSHADMSPESHRRTGFPLVAPHTDVACEGCHRGDSFAARHEPREAQRCEHCHEDPHGDLRAQGSFEGEACVTCHEPTAFRPPRFRVEDHDRTGFALDGAHRAVSCRGCHGDDLSFSVAGAECASCHETPHHFGDRDCAGCHDTRAFTPAIRPFDHGITGFPLRGEHADADCADCHEGRGLRPSTGCASCHGDPHGGQFRIHGADGCLKCHDDEGFELTRFDHDRSRFPLDGKHSELACADCHRPARLRNGREVVRYRPLPIDCAGCHGGDR